MANLQKYANKNLVAWAAYQKDSFFFMRYVDVGLIFLAEAYGGYFAYAYVQTTHAGLVDNLYALSGIALGAALIIAVLNQSFINLAIHNFLGDNLGTGIFFSSVFLVIMYVSAETSLEGADYQTEESIARPDSLKVSEDVISQKEAELQLKIRESGKSVAQMDAQIQTHLSNIRAFEKAAGEIDKYAGNHKGWHTSQPLNDQAQDRYDTYQNKISREHEAIAVLNKSKIRAMEISQKQAESVRAAGEKEIESLRNRNSNLDSGWQNEVSRKSEGTRYVVWFSLAVSLLLGLFSAFVRLPTTGIADNELYNHYSIENTKNGKISDFLIEKMQNYAQLEKEKTGKYPSFNQVATKFEISPNTAKKYLEDFVNMGNKM